MNGLERIIFRQIALFGVFHFASQIATITTFPAKSLYMDTQKIARFSRIFGRF